MKTCELYFSQAIIWGKEHSVLTRVDRAGSRLERVGFVWERGIVAFAWRINLRPPSESRRRPLATPSKNGDQCHRGPRDDKCRWLGDWLSVGRAEEVSHVIEIHEINHPVGVRVPKS